MVKGLYVDPREFERCVGLLTRKLEETAVRAGIADGECIDLDSTLAALPPFSRDRAAVLLQGIRMQAEEEYPAMAFAADYVLKLAREVWDHAPGAPLPAPLRRRHAEA
jgi:hypothetical protein